MAPGDDGAGFAPSRRRDPRQHLHGPPGRPPPLVAAADRSAPRRRRGGGGGGRGLAPARPLGHHRPLGGAGAAPVRDRHPRRAGARGGGAGPRRRGLAPDPVQPRARDRVDLRRGGGARDRRRPAGRGREPGAREPARARRAPSRPGNGPARDTRAASVRGAAGGAGAVPPRRRGAGENGPRRPGPAAAGRPQPGLQRPRGGESDTEVPAESRAADRGVRDPSGSGTGSDRAGARARLRRPSYTRGTAGDVTGGRRHGPPCAEAPQWPEAGGCLRMAAGMGART